MYKRQILGGLLGGGAAAQSGGAGGGFGDILGQILGGQAPQAEAPVQQAPAEQHDSGQWSQPQFNQPENEGDVTMPTAQEDPRDTGSTRQQQQSTDIGDILGGLFGR